VDYEGEVPANVSGSQGVQAGAGNVQNNIWVSKAPLDPASLGVLSPQVAVSRLRALSHDDVVDLFARASPGDVAEVLAAFLEADEDRLVAVLGDVSRRKATELIRPLVETAEWLGGLPVAAEAIARRGVALKWVHSGVLERFKEGYARGYGDGRLFWRDGRAVRSVNGVIEAYRATKSERLKFPTGDQKIAPGSPFGTNGISQSFDNATVYSSKRGIYSVYKTMCFEQEGGSAGWLGFPVGELSTDFGDSLVQHFEGGAIYLSHGDAFSVRSGVAEALSDGQKFRPVSKEITTESSSGVSGMVQRFSASLEDGGKATVAYSSDEYGVVVVDPEIWTYYHALGGEDSWLGFPVNSAEAYEQRGMVQGFEGGAIFWRPHIGPFAVPDVVTEMISKDHLLQGKLGWPVSEELPIGPGESNRIQFFGNGVVTLRDGEREIWLRAR
jgi:hypothetical protein